MREVVNAILYLAGSGCQWRALPKDFPPASTVRGYFYDWRDAGLWQTINHETRVVVQLPTAYPDQAIARLFGAKIPQLTAPP